MMASFNNVVLVGNVTRDPEIRYVGDNNAVCDVGLAINRKFKDKEEVCFVDVTFWGKQAEIICEFVKKGKCLLVQGFLRLHQFEVEGQKRSKLSVVCENFQFMSNKDILEETEKVTKEPKSKNKKQKSENADESDVPF